MNTLHSLPDYWLVLMIIIIPTRHICYDLKLINSPSGDRTHDLKINSLALYQLSYQRRNRSMQCNTGSSFVN